MKTCLILTMYILEAGGCKCVLKLLNRGQEAESKCFPSVVKRHVLYSLLEGPGKFEASCLHRITI